jgi:hydrogenase small subunit
MGIPERMPLGVPKRAYLTLTGVAKSFRIKRFMQKLTEYEK